MISKTVLSGDVVETSRATTFLAQMLLIRRFEERLLELFSEGLLVGTTHCYIGQEANAVGILNHLQPQDIVWSNHRCHGHYLTFTKDADGLMAELMGKRTGVVGGRGGSQHLCAKNFYSNGVQGGIVPAAVGMAFAEKYRNTDAICVVFIGDGTLGEGVVYESFNIASLWNLPVLFVIENNRYAQSTPFERQVAGSIKSRPEAFGIETIELSSFDPLEIFERSAPLLESIRKDQKPRAVVLNTYRFCHHSKSDDFREPAEIENWKKHDPIKLLSRRFSDSVVNSLNAEVVAIVAHAEKMAREAPLPRRPETTLDEDLAL